MVAANRISIELTPNSKALLERAKRELNREHLFQEILGLFDRYAPKVTSFVQANYLRGQRLNVRTGNLARSITGTAVLDRGVPALRVGILRGPALPYAGVQEYGTRGKNPTSPYDTIRPKTGKYLAMPVNDALTPAGVARYTSARQYPADLVFIPFRRGTIAKAGLYRADELKKFEFEDVEPVYILLSELDIEPQWYLRDGMKAMLPGLVGELGVLLGGLLE